MGQPYVGEIRMFGGNFAPAGWSFCNGVILPIPQNDTLFQLIGTTYGGDGQTTFALPDLQCRVPVHQGQGANLSNYVLGQKGGVETVTLTVGQLPSHTHAAVGSGAGGQGAANPANAAWGGPSAVNGSFGPGPSNATMGTITQNAGNSQPHDNLLPFQVISFIISLFGVFPSQ